MANYSVQKGSDPTGGAAVGKFARGLIEDLLGARRENKKDAIFAGYEKASSEEDSRIELERRVGLMAPVIQELTEPATTAKVQEFRKQFPIEESSIKGWLSDADIDEALTTQIKEEQEVSFPGKVADWIMGTTATDMDENSRLSSYQEAEQSILDLYKGAPREDPNRAAALIQLKDYEANRAFDKSVSQIAQRYNIPEAQAKSLGPAGIEILSQILQEAPPQNSYVTDVMIGHDEYGRQLYQSNVIDLNNGRVIAKLGKPKLEPITRTQAIEESAAVKSRQDTIKKGSSIGTAIQSAYDIYKRIDASTLTGGTASVLNKAAGWGNQIQHVITAFSGVSDKEWFEELTPEAVYKKFVTWIPQDLRNKALKDVALQSSLRTLTMTVARMDNPNAKSISNINYKTTGERIGLMLNDPKQIKIALHQFARDVANKFRSESGGENLSAPHIGGLPETDRGTYPAFDFMTTESTRGDTKLGIPKDTQTWLKTPYDSLQEAISDPEVGGAFSAAVRAVGIDPNNFKTLYDDGTPVDLQTIRNRFVDAGLPLSWLDKLNDLSEEILSKIGLSYYQYPQGQGGSFAPADTLNIEPITVENAGDVLNKISDELGLGLGLDFSITLEELDTEPF